MRDALPDWRMKPLVQALQAMRGVQLIAAMTLVAELQDFTRFESTLELPGTPHEPRSGLLLWRVPVDQLEDITPAM